MYAFSIIMNNIFLLFLLKQFASCFQKKKYFLNADNEDLDPPVYLHREISVLVIKKSMANDYRVSNVYTQTGMSDYFFSYNVEIEPVF